MAGSRIVFQILMFTFFVNLSIGLMHNVFPDLYGNGEFDNGLTYDSTAVPKINILSNETINPTSQINGGSGFFSSILDAITAGYFSKIKNFISDNLFGLSHLLNGVFGQYMDSTLRTFVFDILINGSLSLMYIFGMIWMFTGRNFFKESL